jgi:hypothetical protein
MKNGNYGWQSNWNENPPANSSLKEMAGGYFLVEGVSAYL